MDNCEQWVCRRIYEYNKMMFDKIMSIENMKKKTCLTIILVVIIILGSLMIRDEEYEIATNTIGRINYAWNT